MKKFKEFIVNHSVLVVIISLLLLIPSIIGYVNTKINYNILVYLPEDIETISPNTAKKVIMNCTNINYQEFYLLN